MSSLLRTLILSYLVSTGGLYANEIPTFPNENETIYYVAPGGSDTSGNGSSAAPWKTISFAVAQIPAAENNTLFIRGGTYLENEPIQVPLGVNIRGEGRDLVTINSDRPIALPDGINSNSGDFKLWYYGSLIQLYSPGYPEGRLYGSPAEMIPSSQGNQYLTGFTIDGNDQIKAGVWVQNRNQVTLADVTIHDCVQRGAVFARSDMYYYEPLPDGKWMHDTTIYNCVFKNNAAQLGSESLGNLCLAGLDGAEIYDLKINDDTGYGIKFIYVGHYRNTHIRDCEIEVAEADPQWGEKISIELWNLDKGNTVSNITCNTWHSYVNHGQITEYEPVGNETNNLKISNVTMIDKDGVSSKEGIEAALSGIEISDCYIQDKGFGIAVWSGAEPKTPKVNTIIRNNVIANVRRAISFGFGNSSAIFVPDPARNLKIYNNVFDNMGVCLELFSASEVKVKNNIFLNTSGEDARGGTGVYENNLKFHTASHKRAHNIAPLPDNSGIILTVGGGNITGPAGLTETGSRPSPYYQPANSSSLVVDAGQNVALPFIGNAPDIGAYDLASAPVAPTAIHLSPASIKENRPSGSIIGTLSSTDLNLGDTHTYSIVGGDTSYFSIFGNQLLSSTSFDFEIKSVYSLTVRSTDGSGLNFQQTLGITVEDIDEVSNYSNWQASLDWGSVPSEDQAADRNPDQDEYSNELEWKLGLDPTTYTKPIKIIRSAARQTDGTTLVKVGYPKLSESSLLFLHQSPNLIDWSLADPTNPTYDVVTGLYIHEITIPAGNSRMMYRISTVPPPPQ